MHVYSKKVSLLYKNTELYGFSFPAVSQHPGEQNVSLSPFGDTEIADCTVLALNRSKCNFEV
ncbi:MAG: hypothetical protein CSA51_01930 [Gammaproteobacteria bacterium]|nr:MAG: hypothetical protein CSA51_01930 [Gammaproteobacteria bacterium]